MEREKLLNKIKQLNTGDNIKITGIDGDFFITRYSGLVEKDNRIYYGGSNVPFAMVYYTSLDNIADVEAFKCEDECVNYEPWCPDEPIIITKDNSIVFKDIIIEKAKSERLHDVYDWTRRLHLRTIVDIDEINDTRNVLKSFGFLKQIDVMERAIIDHEDYVSKRPWLVYK